MLAAQLAMILTFSRTYRVTFVATVREEDFLSMDQLRTDVPHKPKGERISRELEWLASSVANSEGWRRTRVVQHGAIDRLLLPHISLAM